MHQNRLVSDEATSAEADPGPDGVAGSGDETSTVLSTYRQTNDALENQYLITNPDGAYRRYRGLEISATKRMSNRWQMQFSWVMSKITGNYNNTGSFGNSSEYDDPNQDPRFQPLRDGRLTRDNTHLAKLLGSYHAPGGVVLSGAFFSPPSRGRRSPPSRSRGCCTSSPRSRT